ncbi:hypothetical protein MHYP_G00211130 [Metynnis hypsauchen]
MSSKKVLVSCTVISLQDARFVYPCCKFCLSRSTEESELRSRCVKCGFTCEVQNVDYRYRLSLKVSRGRNLFGLTVFGGCLNSFFGISAGDLQRFVESEKPEGPLSSQQLLIKAVEDCFIGKSFVFGFKLSGLDTEGCLLSDSTQKPAVEDLHGYGSQHQKWIHASLQKTQEDMLYNRSLWMMSEAFRHNMYIHHGLNLSQDGLQKSFYCPRAKKLL